MKIVTVIGARPQFVKASMISKSLRNAGHTEILINTGQHYDVNMSKIFFEEMGIPKPDFDLGVGSGSHAEQTAASMVGIEEIIINEKPDYILVYGDTNATVAGALAAAKLNVKIAHVEAGLRSYNRQMPEEINRIVTDVLSNLLFVPTKVAVENLLKEGLSAGVHVVGDVMVDALKTYTEIAEKKSTILKQSGLKKDKYLLLTIHRPSNADNPVVLKDIMQQVSGAGIPVIFPAHPRIRQKYEEILQENSNLIQVIEPVGYLDMMMLEKYAHTIITDSGGMQKEAYLHRTNCLTVRKETEWVETVNDGWNYLVGSNLSMIPQLIDDFPKPKRWEPHYGNGDASSRILEILIKELKQS